MEAKVIVLRCGTYNDRRPENVRPLYLKKI
jgi:hypothetical protein